METLQRNDFNGIAVQEQDVLKMWQFLANTQDPMNELSRKNLKEASGEELPFKHINKVLTKAFEEMDSHEVAWVLRCGPGSKVNLHSFRVRPDSIWRELQKNRCEEDIIAEAFAMVKNKEGNLDMHKVFYIMETMGYHGLTASQKECQYAKKDLTKRLLQEAGEANPLWDKEKKQYTVSEQNFRKLCSVGRKNQ